MFKRNSVLCKNKPSWQVGLYFEFCIRLNYLLSSFQIGFQNRPNSVLYFFGLKIINKGNGPLFSTSSPTLFPGYTYVLMDKCGGHIFIKLIG